VESDVVTPRLSKGLTYLWIFLFKSVEPPGLYRKTQECRWFSFSFRDRDGLCRYITWYHQQMRQKWRTNKQKSPFIILLNTRWKKYVTVYRTLVGVILAAHHTILKVIDKAVRLSRWTVFFFLFLKDDELCLNYS